MARQIPVYLFVGQLESGKTKFIQETMEDPQFDSGDKTLLLVCEEGEEEYDPDRFAFGGVHVAQLEDKSELTRENLAALAQKSGCGRVIIEYNGMWLVQDLYDALPDNWLIYQCLARADGSTLKTYAGDHAMRALQRSLHIGPGECMAFGDYLNDLELLQACGHSYAMRNAHPRLKAAARFEAPGNDENGVMRVLREAFDLEAEFGPAH